MAGPGPWQPLSLEETAALLGRLDGRWWVAGGWAIDLFLGRQTREHADVDVSVLRADQPHLRDLLAGWDIQVAHDGRLTPWDGEPLTAPRHQFWARPTPDAPWALEILLEDHEGDRWLYRKNHAISMPLDRLGRVSPNKLPYICPEVALLFKAGAAADVPRNAADFAAAAPALDPPARRWLVDALTVAFPGHAWLGRL
jgi:hypothetical protein